VAFAGIDDVVPWDEARLVVTNAAGVAAEEMAQYVIGAIFGLYQRFPFFARRQTEHAWDYRTVRSARGARIGLVGLGRTGEAIARRCRQLGLAVVACRASAKSCDLVDQLYPTTALHDMLPTVDVVVLCAALTPLTRDLFGAAAFAAMRPGGYFINVARGAMVVEEALIDALRSGHLAGAVIDVARTEPLPPDDPLWDAPNLLITPHTSSEYEGWVADAAMMFSANLERWTTGEPLENIVFSERGY
jgi:phosphoglycerate dehydrogenase-like enzyme